MFGLELHLFLLLILCMAAAFAFEFINGFHDAANAVVSVIYTNSLRPWAAIIWAGFWNFIGVIVGGIGVAMSIIYMLPLEALTDQDIYHSISLIGALLLSAIIWNLGTWYYGIPVSSSHTLIGSVFGVGLAYSLLPGVGTATLPWSKISDIGLALLISPLFGFTVTIFLMFLLKRFVKSKKLFKEPHKRNPPPLWIRTIMILTCTGISLSHGSNDGQKGVGLMMLVLIAFLPGYFALNIETDIRPLQNSLTQIENTINSVPLTDFAAPLRGDIADINSLTRDSKMQLASVASLKEITIQQRLDLRKNILNLSSKLKTINQAEFTPLTASQKELVKTNSATLRNYTDYVPNWVIFLTAIAIGCGTLIGWKRIVKTVGEKIGKEHLNYAQGFSSELVAASTIGLSASFGVPVSTTHVFNTAVAGSMVASKGVKNLRPDTVRTIALAWVLTLPVVIFLSGGIFLLLRWLI
ncbi:MAG TPA: inorganic phosphate transporter [Adhaeribacter sp.]|nr:inorganic phosphate transporter [Adhaeribacter sp.]